MFDERAFGDVERFLPTAPAAEEFVHFVAVAVAPSARIHAREPVMIKPTHVEAKRPTPQPTMR